MLTETRKRTTFNAHNGTSMLHKIDPGTIYMNKQYERLRYERNTFRVGLK